MTDKRLILAIGRLERALARAEAAAGEVRGGTPSDLEQRHQSLRARTAEAITRIDALLGVEA